MRILKQTVWLGLLLAPFFLTLSAWSAKKISVRAIASEEYLERRADVDSDEIETYQFFEGRYFGPRMVNDGMERVSFRDVVVDMAQHLVKQNYFPNPQPGKGDLLIVVHYGITDVGHQIDEALDYDSLEDMGVPDSSDGSFNAIAELEFAMSANEAVDRLSDRSSASAARLLGMEDAFGGHPTIVDSRRRELRSMLEEERYFVFLMAYDYSKILQEGKQELLWSTRYSVRAAGIPFEAAIKNLNLVAGDYFGKNMKGLAHKRIDDTSSVDVGDIEIVGQAGDTGRE